MAGLYRRGKIYWGRAQRAGREYRRSLQTAHRAVAQKRLAAWLQDLDAVAWGERARRSFEEAADRFIREHLTTLKPRAAERYGVSLKHLAEHFGGLAIQQIGRAQLSEFETKRRSAGVKAGTIRRDLACLSSLMSSAIDWDWLDDAGNPVPAYLRRRSKRGLKEAPPRTRYLSEAEERAMLAAASAQPRQAMILALDTGLRREELFSLTWAQIDPARGSIATTTLTKNGRARRVPCPPRSAQILAQLPRYLDSPYVLINPDTRTRYVQMNKGLKAAMRRAGIVDLRWHDLRRTAGCRWLQRDGKSMAEVALLLGHSSTTVTEQRYAFLEADAVAESFAARTLPGTGTPDTTPIRKLRQ